MAHPADSEPQRASPLIVELLSWLAVRPRTYDETMAAWRTSCPRHSVWEDATLDGLVEVRALDGVRHVQVTARGAQLLSSATARDAQPS